MASDSIRILLMTYLMSAMSPVIPEAHCFKFQQTSSDSRTPQPLQNQHRGSLPCCWCLVVLGMSEYPDYFRFIRTLSWQYLGTSSLPPHSL
ncbi:hypothetical protein BKA93DRAFT_809481, partial [Sparassis latifolia]